MYAVFCSNCHDERCFCVWVRKVMFYINLLPLFLQHVKMNGVSVFESGDWSDDAVRSGSNTGETIQV